MQTVLTVLGVGFILWILAVVVAFLVARNRLRRRNRVVPYAATSVPLTWLASPATPARLHRRLRDAVAIASGTPSGLDGLGQVRADVAERARQLDQRLTTVARSRGSRRRALIAEVAEETDQLEDIAHRIDHLASRGDRQVIGPGAQPEVERLAEQLTTYESAAEELAAIEREVQGELGT